LRRNHPCDRERIHTINHDRLGCALVTISRVELPVPSRCGSALPRLTKFCNRSAARTVMSFKGAKSALQQEMKPTMKRNLLPLATAGAIALGGFVVVQAQPGSGAAGAGGAGHWHGHAFGLKGITEKLNLTADQQTKVQPILDAAKPQIVAIH